MVMTAAIAPRAIHHEFGDFAAAGQAVVAEQADEIIPRFRRDFEPGLARLAVDESEQSPALVGIAFDRGRLAGALEQIAQRRALFHAARLQDQRAIRRRAFEQRPERSEEIARADIDPERARAAEHRNGIGLVGQESRLFRQRVAFNAHQPHRVGIAAEHGVNQRLGALVNQPFVVAVNEEELHRGGRPPAIGVRAVSFDYRHRLSQLPVIASPGKRAAFSERGDPLSQRAALRPGIATALRASRLTATNGTLFPLCLGHKLV